MERPTQKVNALIAKMVREDGDDISMLCAGEPIGLSAEDVAEALHYYTQCSAHYMEAMVKAFGLGMAVGREVHARRKVN